MKRQVHGHQDHTHQHSHPSTQSGQINPPFHTTVVVTNPATPLLYNPNRFFTPYYYNSNMNNPPHNVPSNPPSNVHQHP